MTGLELFLTSTTLAASAFWLIEWHFRREWEHLAISNGERLAGAVRNTEEALGLIDTYSKLSEDLKSELDRVADNAQEWSKFARETLEGLDAATRKSELSRGIDPRRDALWGDS